MNQEQSSGKRFIRIDSYKYGRINFRGNDWLRTLYRDAGRAWFDHRGRLWFQTALLALPAHAGEGAAS